jgi:light-regulated signal transduction histidine kinase (bacteriophytochrome)
VAASPPSLYPALVIVLAGSGDEARTRGGAGLGLAIVRAIAEAHGGTAELGAGSAVRLRLPSKGDPSSRSYVGHMPTQGGTT